MEEGRPGFAAAWVGADRIPGWLTRAQAAILYDEAAALPPGSTVVEIGSHQGRSTVVLASALPADGILVAIDPFVPGWRYGGPDTRRLLAVHLESAGVADRVDVRSETSRAVRSSYDGRVDLLYVDGKHDYWTVCDDLRWAALVPTGGSVLVHDAFSSLGVTVALLRTLLPSSDLAYAGREGSLARLRREHPTLAQRLRVLAEVPWWVRNLVVKVALRLHLGRVARALGHDLEQDPY